jgi:predicted NAD/FAD-binding protein
MLFDIVRFNSFVSDLLGAPSNSRESHVESIEAYLDRKGYSRQFRDDYLLPMIGSVWANDIEQCRQDFPVGTLVHFL